MPHRESHLVHKVQSPIPVRNQAFRFTLKQLEYFLAAAEAESITLAAARMNISQPSISAAISSLELEFGVSLFVRSPAHGIVVTAAGERLRSEVHNIITHLEGLYAVANELSSVVQGPLSIGCLTTTAPLIVPSLLAPFREVHPAVQVSFSDLHQAEIIQGLRQGRIDLAVTYDMQLPKDVTFTELAILQPHVVVPHDHPLSDRNEVRIEDLADYPYVMLDLPISRDYFRSLLEIGEITPKVEYVSRNHETVLSLVASGYGITISAIVPSRDAALNGRPLTTIPLSQTVPPLLLGLAMLNQGRNTPAARAFKEHCVKQFKVGVPWLSAR